MVEEGDGCVTRRPRTIQGVVAASRALSARTLPSENPTNARKVGSPALKRTLRLMQAALCGRPPIKPASLAASEHALSLDAGFEGPSPISHAPPVHAQPQRRIPFPAHLVANRPNAGKQRGRATLPISSPFSFPFRRAKRHRSSGRLLASETGKLIPERSLIVVVNRLISRTIGPIPIRIPIELGCALKLAFCHSHPVPA